jgi:hypothetical protein
MGVHHRKAAMAGSIWRTALLLLPLLLSPHALAQTAARSPESIRLERTVAEIVSERDPTRRTELTTKLAQSITQEGRATVDDQSVDAIAGLLTDEVRPVRFWAARTLAFLGPMAGHSLTALKQALAIAKREEVEIANKYGFLGGPLLSDTIQSALFRIGGFPTTAYPER